MIRTKVEKKSAVRSPAPRCVASRLPAGFGMGRLADITSLRNINPLPWLCLSVVIAVSILVSETSGKESLSSSKEALAAPAPKAPTWQLSVGAPSVDGTKSISATLRADTPITSGFSKVTPKLVLRYRAGKTSAFILFETFLGSGQLDAVVTFGNTPPEEQSWVISSDGLAAFIPGEALAFAERLKQVDSFSVRITPKKGAPLSVSFTPTETESVIKALISAGVKYGG